MDATRRLACKRCQTRKIKCSRTQPCTNCVQTNRPCEYRSHDGRKHPVSHKYLSALESRLAYFESLIQQLKSASSEERDHILAGITLDDHLQPNDDFQITGQKQASPTGDSEASYTSNTISLRSGPQGSLQFHGPTSIYLDGDTLENKPYVPPVDDFPPKESMTESTAIDALSILRLASALGVNEPLIRETLPLFFLHQYPQYMFIYRETFLSDYYDNSHGGRYWSYPLLYSMCALGAPHSRDLEIRQKSNLLARCAQEIVITHCLTRPSPTTIQALLCLAFHEVGQGNASQGWLFSGMAFRMGQDLGFHQDPKLWVSQDHSITTAQDIEIRRRIYWGSYVADKFMSLYLGRPVYLREDDATVHPTEQLPDATSSHALFRMSELASQYSASNPHRPQLTLGLKYMALLGKIFQDMMADVFSQVRSGTKQKTEANKMARLGELNLKLNRWQIELPDSLKWSQWNTSKSVHTHVLILHMYHQSLLLSLNRHFIHPTSSSICPATSNSPHTSHSSTNEICTSACTIITTLIRQFRSQQNGLHTAPLMLVYALVMAIITQVHTLRMGKDSVKFLMRCLEELSSIYKLAAEARRRLLTSLSDEAEKDMELEVENNGRADQKETPGISSAEHFPSLDLPSDALLGGDGTSPFDTQLDDVFGLPGLNDMAGDFHGWFSIGQMG